MVPVAARVVVDAIESVAAERVADPEATEAVIVATDALAVAAVRVTEPSVRDVVAERSDVVAERHSVVGQLRRLWASEWSLVRLTSNAKTSLRPPHMGWHIYIVAI